MDPHVEIFKSSKTPWEVFQNVYFSSGTNCFFLDSPSYAPPDQTYSYIGANPSFELRLDGDTLFLTEKKPRKFPARKLFPVLKRLFQKNRVRSQKLPFFAGGFVGYLGYELARFCDKIAFRQKRKQGIPDLHLGFFREVIVFDHKKQVYYLVTSYPRKPQALKRYFQDLSQTGEKPFQFKNFVPEISQKKFKDIVLQAKKYIAAGDIYQANLSQRFRFDFSGSSLKLYGRLRAINPSPFACFLKMNDLEIISCSPERLISKKGRECETRPIAGTCPAYGPVSRLKEWREKLLQNEKERAEHLMLVDLERNDLGRVCDYESVRVNEFMVLEKYSHVVHIVSKITGRLKKNKDAFDLIRAMFPGGTITGCPKIRCMQIIDELEPVRRGIYTGSVGYLSVQGDMDLNIAIRTLVLKKNKGYLQVGAGIVYDSDPEKEYEETLHKGEALVKALVEASSGYEPKNF